MIPVQDRGDGITFPNIRVIAHTRILPSEMSDATEDVWIPDDAETSDGDLVAEFAGRACYESWEKPNPKTAANEDYIANILRQHHLSVVEHATFTVYITGVSRTLTHELVRHRHFSFSQRSQRYVDETEAAVVIPPLYLEGWDEEAIELVEKQAAQAREAYNWLVQRYVARGVGQKQARQAARCVLPGGLETRIVVSGNLRTWREFFDKRCSRTADLEIQRLAQLLLMTAARLNHNVFADQREKYLMNSVQAG